MIGRRWMAPVALLSSGCAVRAFTPSVSVVHWAEDVPEPVAQAIANADEAIARWQLPETSPYLRYARYTLLASLGGEARVASLPDVGRLEVVSQARTAAAQAAAAGLPGDTLFLVDLRGAGSVAFGSHLSHLAPSPVACVPTFNHWPAEYEVIPAEETLAAMVAAPPRLPPPHAQATPVVLLDAWRLAFRDGAPDDEYTDNRYALNPGDLPDAASLRALGITRVVYVVEDLDDAMLEEDDLNAPMLEWRAGGISIAMVDLGWFARLDRMADWDRLLDGYALDVKPRRTIFEDPAFYARARSGFGGIHAGPSPIRSGVWFHHGGSYIGRGGGG